MIVSILLYLGLSVLFVKAEPLIELKRRLGFKEEDYDSFKPVKKWVHKLIYCLYCSSVYITFIFTLDAQLAVIVSLFAYMLENKF